MRAGWLLELDGAGTDRDGAAEREPDWAWDEPTDVR